MPLKYLADIIEHLTSKKCVDNAKYVGFSLEATIKIELITALYCTIFLFFIWLAVNGILHCGKQVHELHDPGQLYPFQDDMEDEIPEIIENLANEQVAGTGDPTDIKDEDMTNDEESWNGPIVQCDCCKLY